MHEKLGLVVDPYASSKEDYLDLGKTESSWQEAREQQIIEDSVKISLEEKRVIVTYPFLKDPVAFLTHRHKGSNNFNQALKVYKSQCRKSVDIREGAERVSGKRLYV